MIMCNGYLLVDKPPEVEKIGQIYVYEKPDPKQWIVTYTGSLNKKYYRAVAYGDIERLTEQNPDKKVHRHMDQNVLMNHHDRSDQGTEIVQEGDTIIIDNPGFVFPLEDYAYARFSSDRKVFFVCPRHCIQAIMRD